MTVSTRRAALTALAGIPALAILADAIAAVAPLMQTPSSQRLRLRLIVSAP